MFCFTSAQYDSRGEEISRLEATNCNLNREQKDLTKQLSDKKYEIQVKKDDCKNLQTKYVTILVTHCQTYTKKQYVTILK